MNMQVVREGGKKKSGVRGNQVELANQKKAHTLDAQGLGDVAGSVISGHERQLIMNMILIDAYSL